MEKTEQQPFRKMKFFWIKVSTFLAVVCQEWGHTSSSEMIALSNWDLAVRSPQCSSHHSDLRFQSSDQYTAYAYQYQG